MAGTPRKRAPKKITPAPGASPKSSPPAAAGPSAPGGDTPRPMYITGETRSEYRDRVQAWKLARKAARS